MFYWTCDICEYIYDECDTGSIWEGLPKNWSCPHCGAPKDCFVLIELDSDA